MSEEVDKLRLKIVKAFSLSPINSNETHIKAAELRHNVIEELLPLETEVIAQIINDTFLIDEVHATSILALHTIFGSEVFSQEVVDKILTTRRDFDKNLAYSLLESREEMSKLLEERNSDFNIYYIVWTALAESAYKRNK